MRFSKKIKDSKSCEKQKVKDHLYPTSCCQRWSSWWWASCLGPDVSLSAMMSLLLALLCDSLMPLLYTLNAGQRWWIERRWCGREIELSNRRQGGRQEACNRSCVCMFFLKKVRWMLRCLQAAPCYRVNPAPLALHHQHWSLHIAGWQCWWLTGWWVDAHKHTHTHTVTWS